MGISLYRLHVYKGGSHVDTSHIFPLGVLVAITLLGNGAGDGGARAGTACEAASPLYSDHYCPIGEGV